MFLYGLYIAYEFLFLYTSLINPTPILIRCYFLAY